MIFYFSGTGNSLWVAKKLAEYSGEQLISIADCLHHNGPFEFTLQVSETIGFVLPVYAWAPPSIVLQFVDKLRIGNASAHFTYVVVTCGDNIGNTVKVLTGRLKKQGLHVDSAFSVQMPNNYIVALDIDPAKLQKAKLDVAADTLKKIGNVVLRRKKGVFDLVQGGLIPTLMTRLTNPLFNRIGVQPERFYATDACTGCKICEKVCNCWNITVEGKPRWGNQCVQCFACLHYCPVKAVQYGKGTEKKGRYVHPEVNVAEMYRK